MPSKAGSVMNSDIDHDLAPNGGRNGSRITNGRGAQRSSPRPYGPPSESNGALSDVEGFPDDEIVGARGTARNRARDPMAQAVPKVVDKVGEKVAEEFENFLDQYAPRKQAIHSKILMRSDSLRTLSLLGLLLQAH